MIGFLRGHLVHPHVLSNSGGANHPSVESVIIECQGVGYEVSMTPQSILDLQSLSSETVQVWVHTHVREDALQLFGFCSPAEKDFFLQLLKVNGVGPKSALSILSGAPFMRICEWIDSGDAKALSQLPKVGKKTAEQIVLTLKGKLVSIEAEAKASKKNATSNAPKRSINLQQISSALVNLGFKPQIVEAFVETLPADAGVEEGVRSGLQKLSGQI